MRGDAGLAQVLEMFLRDAERFLARRVEIRRQRLQGIFLVVICRRGKDQGDSVGFHDPERVRLALDVSAGSDSAQMSVELHALVSVAMRGLTVKHQRVLALARDLSVGPAQ